MKQLRAIIMLLLCLWRLDAAAQETNGVVFILGGGSSVYGPSFHHQYFTLSQLAASPTWDPVSQPLPIDVGAAFVRARNLTMQSERLPETLPFFVDTIQIIQLSWDEHNTNALEAPSLANKWTIQFDTRWLSNRVFNTIFALMDETYAAAFDPAQLRTLEMTNEFRKSISRFSPIVLVDMGHYGTNNQDMINKSDFRVPNVHWNPNDGLAYPLDLQAEAMRGRDIAATKNLLNKESLSLVRISLSPYPALKASTFFQLSPADRTNNWMTSFEYVTASNKSKRYWVYELLDGRIVE